MLDKNISRASIIDLVSVIKFETLAYVCSTIDRNYESNTPIKNWGLFEVDEDKNSTKQIRSINESLMEFDPSGKEFISREPEGTLIDRHPWQ